MVNFSDPEGYIDSSDDPPLPDGTSLYCNYTITVYIGYGVELQVHATKYKHAQLQHVRHICTTVLRACGGHFVVVVVVVVV